MKKLKISKILLLLCIFLMFTSSIFATCNDNWDDDGDGLTDWQYDLGCYGPDDPTEGGIQKGLDNGWTVFEASPDTRIIYVSSSDGDDTFDGLSPSTPKKTIAAGNALLRDTYPDWMLLKRGDVWIEERLEDEKSGRSETEMMLIASYGDSTVRPMIKKGDDYAWENGYGWQQSNPDSDNHHLDHFGIIGLHIYAYKRDPNSPDYAGRAGGQAIRRLIPGENFHIEYSRFEYCAVVLDIGGYTTDLQGYTFRRNVIDHTYTSGGHSQGTFISNAHKVLLEENVFDHNGWNTPEQRTQYNHNIYYQKDSGGDLVARGNIIARGSASGLQARSGGDVEDNFFVNNSLNWGWLGGNVAGWPGGVVGRVGDNVFLNDGAVHLPPRKVGEGAIWAVTVGNVKSGLIENNIIARQQLGPGASSRAFGFSGKVVTGIIGINDLTLKDNIVYEHKVPMTFTFQNFKNMRIENNVFHGLPGDYLVTDRDIAPVSEITFLNNHYYNSDPMSTWYKINDVDYDYSYWTNYWGETGATNHHVTFVDPTRTTGSYHATLGKAPTMEAFLDEAVLQSKYNWRQEYTAYAINDYIREGFQYTVCTTGTDVDGDNFYTDCGQIDCNDNDANINPAATDIACDTIDQNCDGKDATGTDVDGDGFSGQTGCGILDCNDNDNQMFPGNTEICDGKDNDCNSQTDENLVAPNAFNQNGVCLGSKQVCNNLWQEPNYVTLTNYESPETLCDSLDNDCDGTTDEGCACSEGASQQCGTSEVGACQYGTQTCTAGIWSDCSGNIDPVTETCNNIDDDCDTTVDELLKNCATAEILPPCAPNWQCTEWSECTEKRRKSRECTDLNTCDTLIGRPSISSACFGSSSSGSKTTSTTSNPSSPKGSASSTPSWRKSTDETTEETNPENPETKTLDSTPSSGNTLFYSAVAIMVVLGGILFYYKKKGFNFNKPAGYQVRDLLKEDILELRKGGKSEKEIIDYLKRKEFDEKTIKEKLK